MTDKKIVFAYVRVSEAREGMVSPEIQAREIREYCSRKDWIVAEVFQDLDLAASQLPPEKRPALQEMLRRAENRECDMVVFYAIDRLARRMEDHYAILASLKESGVGVDSVGTPYQDTPEGAFLWDITAALASLVARRLGKRIRDSHRTLRAAGRFPGGPPPYGMRRTEPGPGLEPEPIEAQWVVQMHQWFQRGWSITRIARELNALGVPTRSGGKWLASTIVRILQRPTLAGGRLDDGVLKTGGNISPVVSEECWRRTQAMMSGNYERFRAGRTSRGPIPSRLVRCGSCGRSLRVHHRGDGIISLRCWASYEGACEQGVSIYAHVLETEVQGQLLSRLARTKAIPPATKNADTDLDALSREVGAARAALERLALAYAEGAMELTEYQGARVKLVVRLERAERQREKESAKLEGSVVREAIRKL